MNDKFSPRSESFNTLARARLREMRQTVRTTTEALGLPPEAEGAVVAALFAEETTAAFVRRTGGITESAQAADEVSATGRLASPAEEELRTRLFGLVDGFLRAHLRSRAEEFQMLWEALASTPVEGIRRMLGTRQAVPAGLGFDGGDEELLRIVAVAAWALTDRPSKEAILQEAERQGLPRARRHALAAYLASHLDDV